jgi:AcrR family transcriptional regulator
MASRERDLRFLRTHGWILRAFNELIFKRAYAGLSTANIIKRAGVGRSTFYEHFRNKDEVLLQSVSRILATLADSVLEDGDVRRIRGVVDHLLDQKEMTQPMLAGPAGGTLTAELARLVEVRLAGRDDGEWATDECPADQCAKFVVPVRLVALQVAEAQMALLLGWLEDEARCSAQELTSAICRSSRGLVDALACGVVVK